MRLDDILVAQLELHGLPVSKSKVRRLVMSSSVQVNGRVCRLATMLMQAGMQVQARVDEQKLLSEKKLLDVSFTCTQAHILYEDEYLLVLNKPAGLPTDGSFVSDRDHICAAVQRFLVERSGRQDSYCCVQHRLDKDTSGVLVFSLQKHVNAGLHAAFEEHRVVKTYLALTTYKRFSPHETIRVTNQLARVSPKSAPCKWGPVATAGLRAETAFMVLQTGRLGSLIEARPQTGRTHQIRVHLAGLGAPIAGDSLYGGVGMIANLAVPRVMLHAASLGLTHPLTGVALEFNAPLPPDFRDCLQHCGIRY